MKNNHLQLGSKEKLKSSASNNSEHDKEELTVHDYDKDKYKLEERQ